MIVLNKARKTIKRITKKIRNKKMTKRLKRSYSKKKIQKRNKTKRNRMKIFLSANGKHIIFNMRQNIPWDWIVLK
jgi:hypothetical protein